MQRLLTATLILCGCAVGAYAQGVEPPRTENAAPGTVLIFHKTTPPTPARNLRRPLVLVPLAEQLAALRARAPFPPQPSAVPSVGISVTLVSRQQDDSPAIIAIKGYIVFGDDKKFYAATEDITKAIVFLQSPGGNVGAATGIGLAIRAKGFQTAVSNNTICASACALAWLGGLTRFAGESASIGFHAASYPDNYKTTDGALLTSDPNSAVEKYLNKLGMHRTAFLYVTKADPKHMTWLSGGDTIHGIHFESLDASTAALATRTTQR